MEPFPRAYSRGRLGVGGCKSSSSRRGTLTVAGVAPQHALHPARNCLEAHFARIYSIPQK